MRFCLSELFGISAALRTRPPEQEGTFLSLLALSISAEPAIERAAPAAAKNFPQTYWRDFHAAEILAACR